VANGISIIVPEPGEDFENNSSIFVNVTEFLEIESDSECEDRIDCS